MPVALSRCSLNALNATAYTRKVSEDETAFSPQRARTCPLASGLSEQEVAELHTQIEQIVQRFQGTFDKTENWGRRKLAYEIGHHREGTYVVETITGSPKSHVMGLCAGGITASCAVGHLAATEQLDRIAGLTLGVCVLDNENAGTLGALVDNPTAAASVAESQRKGYLDGRALAGLHDASRE